MAGIRRKYIRAAAAAAMGAALLLGSAACALPNSAVNTQLALDEAGGLLQTIVEEKGPESYQEEDLRSFVKEQVEAYVGKSGGEKEGDQQERVKLNSCSVNGNTVKIVLQYASVADYSAFNQVPCFNGTLQEAEEAGYPVLSQAYVARGGAEQDLGVLEQRQKEWKVLVLSEPVLARVPDKILYVTDNVSITGRLTAEVRTVAAEATPTPSSAPTPSSTEAPSGTAQSSTPTPSGTQAPRAALTAQTVADTATPTPTAAPPDKKKAEQAEDVAALYAAAAERYAYIIYK